MWFALLSSVDAWGSEWINSSVLEMRMTQGDYMPLTLIQFVWSLRWRGKSRWGKVNYAYRWIWELALSLDLAVSVSNLFRMKSPWLWRSGYMVTAPQLGEKKQTSNRSPIIKSQPDHFVCYGQWYGQPKHLFWVHRAMVNSSEPRLFLAHIQWSDWPQTLTEYAECYCRLKHISEIAKFYGRVKQSIYDDETRVQIDNEWLFTDFC